MKFRKKPVVIEAIQFTKESVITLSGFVGQNFEYGIGLDGDVEVLIIKTLEGNMEAKIGDWIIRGISGEFYPIKNDIFEKTYEKVEEE